MSVSATVPPGPEHAVRLAEEAVAGAEVEGALQGQDPVEPRVGEVQRRRGAEPEVNAASQTPPGDALPALFDVRRGDVDRGDVRHPKPVQEDEVLLREAGADVEDPVARPQPGPRPEQFRQRPTGVGIGAGVPPVPEVEPQRLGRVREAPVQAVDDVVAQQRVVGGRVGLPHQGERPGGRPQRPGQPVRQIPHAPPRGTTTRQHMIPPATAPARGPILPPPPGQFSGSYPTLAGRRPAGRSGR
jgi:hypothetical protein